MKRRYLFLPLIAIVLLLVGCSNTQSPKENSEPQKFIVGASGDLNRLIWEDVAERLKPQGVNVEIKMFSEFIQPDIALNEGDIDANTYQYPPFLLDTNTNHDLDLIPVGYATITPIGIWTPKSKDNIKSLEDIPGHATVAIGNDPVNLNHELRIFEQLGLIELTKNEGQLYTQEDITANPHQLEFKEVDTASMMSFVDDVDLFITGASVAGSVDYTPEEALFIEDPKDVSDDYKLVFAVRAEDKDDPTVQKVLKEFQSDATVEAMDRITHGQYLPGWDRKNVEKDNEKAYNHFQELKKAQAQK
ncbi:MAG: MetQ/NlpA family ABC transporter substrate-binding protein [Aerococcus sp.]|nr:MetQ/NlpA family ABC transporter substrate-binding protein [Aerococcus sp.]